MNHKLALEEQLPDKYVFGELSETERDDFEEHLADCPRCMEDVKLAQSFAANSLAVFRDHSLAPVHSPPKKDPFAWWKGPGALAFSGGLNLALAGAALYAFLAVVPLLKTEVQSLAAPAISQSFVLQGASRSALPVYVIPRNSAATFRLDLPQPFDHYVCVIKSAASGSQKTYNLPGTARDAEMLNVTIPVAGLDPGDHNVELSGVQGTNVDLLARFVLRVTPGK